jgi:flagellar biosynthetic protein FlhB
MADTDQEQKTEEPTAKRLSEARTKGDVPSSPEARHVSMFVGMMIVTGGLGAWTMASLGTMLVRLWGNAEDYALEPLGAQNFITGIFRQTALSVAPLFATLFACALITLFMQGQPTLAWTRVAPKWSKLSPVGGFKRLFGKRAFVEFAKMLAKFAVIATVMVFILWPRAAALDQLVGSPTDRIGQVAGMLAFQLVRAVGILVATLGLADFIYQRRAFLKRMRMTLQEVKDEHKNSQGDPVIKRRIRTIQMQRARRRMMASVPTASVIITNPTHYAVALKYEHGTMAAPIVVAKGVDEVALRIREVAGAHSVPIVESPPLARALYAAVDIDRSIPVEHYAAVAEIIGYVMRLSRRVA